MAQVMQPPPTLAPEPDKESSEYVYFHSGASATYRRVTSTPSSSFTSIPTVDLSTASGTPSQRLAIATEIRSACETCGFFYVKNHGIPQEEIDEVFALLKRFFALELETKMEAHVQKNPAIRGYEPMLETRLDPRTKGDLKEAFTLGDDPLEPEQSYTAKTGLPPPSYLTRPQNIWPSSAPWWRAGLYKYYARILPLATMLVRLIALALEGDEAAFDYMFGFPITGMRPLYYPPTPVEDDEGSVGLGAHADFSYLTLVLQDTTPALEILNPSGCWIPAPPLPGTFVCNVGQYLELQTRGRFPATVHRVRNVTAAERYSLPFFLSPDAGADMVVLGEGEEEKVNVGDLYIRRILPARRKHPTSIKYRDVPQEEWSYQMLLM